MYIDVIVNEIIIIIIITLKLASRGSLSPITAITRSALEIIVRYIIIFNINYYVRVQIVIQQ